MAMLYCVKMTSRCIRPKTVVETEIIPAGSFLKGRTRCCFFTTACQQLTPFCKSCGFPRRIVPVYHRDSRQEFAKVGGIFPILHVVILLDASN